LRITPAKRDRLRALSTSAGVIAAIAVDQRKSLRRLIADARGADLKSISDEALGEFKSAVARVLTPHASAVLIDSEFGATAFRERAAHCGLLITYECDGYENPRPHRMLALMPHLSVRRLRDLGADGIKILLSYAPSDDAAANDAKCAMIERIGHECETLDMPFFLEPVCYDPHGLDPKSLEFARRKPEWVIRLMEEFSKDVYKVDVLKVEFPVNVSFVEGSAVYEGVSAYSRTEALQHYCAADAVARRPYIYLSAGVSAPHFVESLRLAAESGAHYSGVLCGRATWQGGVPAFASDGPAAFENWLKGEGVRNIQALNECLRTATPWEKRLGRE
jgi:tagatose 1,6-diphosphate aldolase